MWAATVKIHLTFSHLNVNLLAHSFLSPHSTETIFVRAYEERMDLLRAVIVGPAGTPYHDGLFFFDFQFPSNYPHIPPVLESLWTDICFFFIFFFFLKPCVDNRLVGGLLTFLLGAESTLSLRWTPTQSQPVRMWEGLSEPFRDLVGPRM